MNLKRIISIITALCLVLGTMATGVVFAAEEIDAIKTTASEVSETFQNYSSVANGSSISNLSGWSFSHPDAPGKSSSIVADPLDSTGNNRVGLYYTDGNTYTTQGYITYAKYAPSVKVSNDYILVSAKILGFL